MSSFMKQSMNMSVGQVCLSFHDPLEEIKGYWVVSQPGGEQYFEEEEYDLAVAEFNNVVRTIVVRAMS